MAAWQAGNKLMIKVKNKSFPNKTLPIITSSVIRPVFFCRHADKSRQIQIFRQLGKSGANLAAQIRNLLKQSRKKLILLVLPEVIWIMIRARNDRDAKNDSTRRDS